MAREMTPQIKALATKADSLSSAWDPQVGQRRTTSHKLSSDINIHHWTCAQEHPHAHIFKSFSSSFNRLLTLQTNNKQSNKLQAWLLKSVSLQMKFLYLLQLCSFLNLFGGLKYFLFLDELSNLLVSYLQKNISGILNRISLNLRTSAGDFACSRTTVDLSTCLTPSSIPAMLPIVPIT